MKRFIPTIILVVLCIGAFWYASSQSFFKSEEEESAEKPLVTVQQSDITKFQIKHDGVALEKKDGKWAITQPAAYPTNAYSGDSWTGSLTSIKQDMEIEANPSSLAPFGLDKPQQEFEITLADGTVRTVQVGSSLPIAGHHYVKLKEEPAVYRVADDQIQPLQKDVSEFVDKSPFQMVYTDVSYVQMEWNGATKTLQKNDVSKSSTESAWTFEGKEMTGREVEPILDKMLLMSSDQMVRSMAEMNMSSPEMKIVLKSHKDGKETTATYIGKVAADRIWIGLQEGPWAFEVPLMSIQELFDRIKLPDTPQQPAAGQGQ